MERMMKDTKLPTALDTQKNMNDQRVVVDRMSNRPTAPTKTDGVKVRGTGCAVKGLLARGPMA